MEILLKWFGTITILLLFNMAVDARAQTSTESASESTAESAEQPSKGLLASSYRLTVTIHGAFGLCHNDEFGSQELYVVIKRLDLALQDQLYDLEREGQQITGKDSWRYAERHVDSLRKQDFNSKSDPLSKAELESLERLRNINPSEHTDDQVREFTSLQTRAPISTADESVLARMKGLETQRRRLLRDIQMHSSANKPSSLRVYPHDELQIVLMEDDPFFDDTCFGSTVMLDQSVLAMPSVEIKKDENHLLTLHLTPLHK